ncbi:16S rRNA (uracil(1498)-N(3))-methyltransferase [Ekhidna sp. To15]|uniref:16S rRNA (uracil(1498)-N(3))-methyltransferase n=1 Tax=Ekhidna sp. To15 TaxID=3395267 RepID=UPI003F51AC95
MAIFYQNHIQEGENFLSEEESKHCAQVLRHQKGDEILVFDGNGGEHRSVLTQINKKSCAFNVIESIHNSKKRFKTHLAIAPTKNADRIEWLIEKLCEIGVDEVTFILSKHSERKKLRLDRLEKKAISAMKQSRNPFLLKLNELTPLDSFLAQNDAEIKLIAHVDDSHRYISESLYDNRSVAILIGPEGDFSLDEVQLAKSHGFETISLGQNTLRTETAGFVACCLVNSANTY